MKNSMDRIRGRARMAGALFAIALAAILSVAVTAADVATTAPLHGGVVSATKSHVFETVVSNDGIRVYLYTDERAPAMMEKATGKAMLKLPDGRSLEVKLVRDLPGTNEASTYFCPMHPEVVRDKPGKCELCGGMVLFQQDRLWGKVDLGGVKAADLSAMVQVSGLRGREKEATFTPAFRTPDRKAE